VELDSGSDDLYQHLLPRFFVPDDPRAEPVIHCALRVRVRLVCHGVAKQRKLEAPALHVFVAHIGFREFMSQMQPCPAFVRLQANGNARASGRYRLAACETVGECDQLRLTHFQYFT
jgi:hypothetical protein